MDSLDRQRDRQPPRLTALYRVYLQKHDIREFVNRIAECYNEVSLIRLTESLCIETRRATTLALDFLGTYQANDSLGLLLKDRDPTVRLMAERSLKSVWSRDGSEEQRQELYAVMRLIAVHNFGEAVHRANILLDEYPRYVEARNQRAIASFALKNFEEAIEDSRIVLDLNPYHFGGAIVMGHAYLQLHDQSNAIESFQRALAINPNLNSIRRHLEHLTQSWMR